MFNRQTTLRGALMIIDRHFGQHLGQATTYALINGVVPPLKQKTTTRVKAPDSRAVGKCPARLEAREELFSRRRAALLGRADIAVGRAFGFARLQLVR